MEGNRALNSVLLAVVIGFLLGLGFLFLLSLLFDFIELLISRSGLLILLLFIILFLIISVIDPLFIVRLSRVLGL